MFPYTLIQMDIGDRVRYDAVANKPVGIIYHIDAFGDRCTVKWDNPDALPRTQDFPLRYMTTDNFTILDKNGFQMTRSACFHEWVDYHGFNESYQYCKLCDEKRGERGY